MTATATALTVATQNVAGWRPPAPVTVRVVTVPTTVQVAAARNVAALPRTAVASLVDAYVMRNANQDPVTPATVPQRVRVEGPAVIVRITVVQAPLGVEEQTLHAPAEVTRVRVQTIVRMAVLKAAVESRLIALAA